MRYLSNPVQTNSLMLPTGHCVSAINLSSFGNNMIVVQILL